MDDKRVLQLGVVGAAVAAVCCFTPLLVVLLGAVGLSAIVGWLDYVLHPALVVFLGIIVYALVRRQRSDSSASPTAREET